MKGRANSRDNGCRQHAGTEVYREPREKRPLAGRQSWHDLPGLMANDEDHSCRADLHNLLSTDVSTTNARRFIQLRKISWSIKPCPFFSNSFEALITLYVLLQDQFILIFLSRSLIYREYFLHGRSALENISIKSSSGWPIVNCTMLRVQANVSIHGSMIEEFRQESNIIYTVIDILINEFILRRLNEGSRTRRTRIESIWNVKQISMVPPSSSCRSDIKVMNAPAFSKVARRLARVA